MPKSTFNNLSQERKNEIIQACFEEFAQHDYKNASVSRIVLKLGIAKGSFYRYFESKKALYLFLVDQATALRTDHVKEFFELPAGDFFSLFEQNFSMQIRFYLSYPLQSTFLYNSMQERTNEELSNLLIRSKEMMIELLTSIIETYKAKRALRMDIRTDLMAYLIMQIQLGINDFLTIRHKIDQQKNIKEQKQAFSIPEQEIASTAKEFSEILAHGLAKK